MSREASRIAVLREYERLLTFEDEHPGIYNTRARRMYALLLYLTGWLQSAAERGDDCLAVATHGVLDALRETFTREDR